MKKSMPEDLWSNYYDYMVLIESDEIDMEELGEFMESALATIPYGIAAAKECGVELDI
jgi:hypothetical protein